MSRPPTATRYRQPTCRSPVAHPARWWNGSGGTAPATWVMLGLVAIYVSVLHQPTLDIHHGLGTSAYDSGLYDQGVWLMSRFKAPFVTLMGRNLFGDHASFILVGLVPLYWVAPGSWILFFSQSALLGAGRVARVRVRPAATRLRWLGCGVRCGVPAAPGGVVDEHGELPPRLVPRAVRRVGDLRRAGAALARSTGSGSCWRCS